MQRNPVIVAMLFALIVVGNADGQSTSATISDNYPEQPIKVIVPFGAGGGSDTFVRILQKAIKENDLLSQPLIIINVPGAGGTIGSRQAMESEPDGYTLLCLHEGIISAKYAGSADYGPEAFEPVAGTGEVGNVIAVAADSKYTDLDQLLTEKRLCFRLTSEHQATLWDSCWRTPNKGRDSGTLKQEAVPNGLQRWLAGTSTYPRSH